MKNLLLGIVIGHLASDAIDQFLKGLSSAVAKAREDREAREAEKAETPAESGETVPGTVAG